MLLLDSSLPIPATMPRVSQASTSKLESPYLRRSAFLARRSLQQGIVLFAGDVMSSFVRDGRREGGARGRVP